MRLVPITADDEDLIVHLECDPEMMRHFGGPRPEADVRAAHKRRLGLMEKGILPNRAAIALGSWSDCRIDSVESLVIRHVRQVRGISSEAREGRI
jgi:hypothetical protein